MGKNIKEEKDKVETTDTEEETGKNRKKEKKTEAEEDRTGQKLMRKLTKKRQTDVTKSRKKAR